MITITHHFLVVDIISMQIMTKFLKIPLLLCLTNYDFEKLFNFNSIHGWSSLTFKTYFSAVILLFKYYYNLFLSFAAYKESVKHSNTRQLFALIVNILIFALL